MDDELPTVDALVSARLADELLSERAALPMGHHPAHHVPAVTGWASWRMTRPLREWRSADMRWYTTASFYCRLPAQHHSHGPTPFATPFDEYRFLLAFINRLLLKLLGYRGRYLDWNVPSGMQPPAADM